MTWWAIVLIVIVALVMLLFLVYWFNLDMKLIYKLSPVFRRNYDNMERDRRM